MYIYLDKIEKNHLKTISTSTAKVLNISAVSFGMGATSSNFEFSFEKTD